jgi:hypothetical protein
MNQIEQVATRATFGSVWAVLASATTSLTMDRAD